MIQKNTVAQRRRYSVAKAYLRASLFKDTLARRSYNDLCDAMEAE